MLELDSTLWFRAGSDNLSGKNRVALLKAIGETGSITAAAKAVGVSYKWAWDAVDAMNNLAGEPLVSASTGGKGGGGTRLTPRGESLIATFEIIEREQRRFVQHIARLDNASINDIDLIRRFTLKTSARNKLFGKVAAIHAGAVNDEVEVETQGGQRVVATITRDSVDTLALAVGTECIALIKASSVLIGVGSAMRLSARNQLPGRVARIKSGAVNAEVVVDLAKGGTIVAIVSLASATELQLEEGKDVVAIFDASSVILGTID